MENIELTCACGNIGWGEKIVQIDDRTVFTYWVCMRCYHESDHTEKEKEIWSRKLD